MIKIWKIDGKHFNTYYGDGVIVYSQQVQQHYNLSVGGPIVYPLTEAFIITPISTFHSLIKDLCYANWFWNEFKIVDNQGAVVIVDGQEILIIEKNQSIKK